MGIAWNGWFPMENLEMDDLGVPPFQETSVHVCYAHELLKEKSPLMVIYGDLPAISVPSGSKQRQLE